MGIFIFFVPMGVYKNLLKGDGNVFEYVDVNTLPGNSSTGKHVDELYLRLCDVMSPIEIDVMLKFNSAVSTVIGGFDSGSLLTEVFNRRRQSIDYNQLVLDDYHNAGTGLLYKYCNNILFVGSEWDVLSRENVPSVVDKLTRVIGAMYGERNVVTQPFYESLVKRRA